jgi:hypothetical protein
MYGYRCCGPSAPMMLSLFALWYAETCAFPLISLLIVVGLVHHWHWVHYEGRFDRLWTASRRLNFGAVLARYYGMFFPCYSGGYPLNYLQFWCLAEILYVPTVALIKCSIALYLIRIAVKPIHIWTVCLSMAIFLAYSVGFFVVLLMQCRPISFYWRQALGDTDGVCWDTKTVAGVAYGHGGTSVLTDITLGIIPAFIVADLQITKRTKVAVAFTLALGSV